MMDGWMDEWKEGRKDELMDRWIDGMMEGRTKGDHCSWSAVWMGMARRTDGLRSEEGRGGPGVE